MQAVAEETISRTAWFDEFVGILRAHELQLETGVASDGLKAMYDQLMTGSMDDLLKSNKNTIQQHFVKKIIFEYSKLAIGERKVTFKTLAFSYNDSEVLVWAEIPSEREDLERALILTEAKINAKYHNYGFDMNTTIVEECDSLLVPSHYISILG